jgi:hypothetical protein
MASSGNRAHVRPAPSGISRPAAALSRRVLGLLVSLFVLSTPAVVAQTPFAPKPVLDLVYARPFTLDKGYQYDWSKDRPIVSSGTLVVLKVDPSLVVPRNALEPVLYAGDWAVQRLNHGDESGYVIGIIPGDVDLTRTPIWFGRPALPERVTAATIRTERASADAAKIRPFTADRVRTVTQEPLQAPDLFSLLRDHVANLVLEFSPREKDLAETWRLPVASAPPRQQ